MFPILTDDPGWHGHQLQQAFRLRGYASSFVSLKDCYLDLSGDTPRVVLPGFPQLPDAVFVRGVPGGSLQQVILRLDILHALQAMGVLVYNSTRAIERTVDKAMTSFLLKLHGLATPASWICESRHHAAAILARESAHVPLVIKPLFGSQGKGIRQLTSSSPLPVPMEMFVDGVYYLQHFVNSGVQSHDYRVFVVAHQAVASMARYGTSWINNVALGGRCEPVPTELNTALSALAERASVVLDMDYCGVDIIVDQQGCMQVLEVNSIPAWRGLQKVSPQNIAQVLVDDFLSSLNQL